MIVSQLIRAAALSLLHGHRIVLRPVAADKPVPQTVKSIRLLIHGKILKTEFLVKQITFNHSVLIRGAGAVQTHLEILVVNGNMMEREFTITEQTQIPGPGILILHHHIPQFQLVPQWHGKRLLRPYFIIAALIHRVGHPMTADIFRLIQGFPHRLPGNTPIVFAVIVPEIHIMPRPVHRHAVSPESRNPVILRGLVEKVASRRMVYHRAEIFHPQIISPGYRQIHPVNYILPIFIIKMAIFHLSLPPSAEPLTAYPHYILFQRALDMDKYANICLFLGSQLGAVFPCLYSWQI